MMNERPPIPFARYTVLIDRYLTDDSDGTGVHHDGSGEQAVEQLVLELQEAFDAGSVEGYFRIVQLSVGGEVGFPLAPLHAVPTHYDDDPPELRPTPRFGVETLMAGNDTMFSDIEVTLWAVVDQISDPEQAQIICAVHTNPETAKADADRRNFWAPILARIDANEARQMSVGDFIGGLAAGGGTNIE